MINITSKPAQKNTGHSAEMLQIGQYTKTVTNCNNIISIACKSNHYTNTTVTAM